jgi:acetylornithine deacetylase/succinyl-diaminopimelate desuccinylase-like protein
MDVVELTKKLISIESTTGNEREIAEFIASQLEFKDVELQDVKGFGPNVIARHVIDPNNPIIVLNCHMDTVEVMQGWDSEPFTPRIDGNKLFGLGACDMKAGIAIAIDVFKKATKDGANIIFTAVSDEEGNSKGAHLLIQEKLKKELKGNLEDHLCLIPEDTNERVVLGARGRHVIEITVTGRSAHGATPECGLNAIQDAAIIINALGKLPLNSHPKLGKGSICILKIHGGGNSLSVPDRCKIRVDRHTVVGDDEKKIMSDFRDLLGTLDLRGICSIDWMKRETPFLEPYIMDIEDLWTTKFLSSYMDFFRKETDISYGKSVGDFNAFGKIIPTIVFGPKGVYADSIIRCRDFYLDFLAKKL